jgi:hypothetical protein
MIRNLAERKKNWTPHPYKIRLLDARAVVKTVAFVYDAENTLATSMVLTGHSLREIAYVSSPET